MYPNLPIGIVWVRLNPPVDWEVAGKNGKLVVGVLFLHVLERLPRHFEHSNPWAPPHVGE